ncbi:MAG TPA: hypothetical protein VGX28_02475 [Frankiaceae bacterium]|jgi:hypothetical protein|nr:hypothetical protein [Frankiaceae bacterium]
MLDTTERPGVDPDPFSIGIALFSAMAGGAAFLETRRSRTNLEQAQRRAFRAAWFETRRSLIFFKRGIDEFETYMLEDGYGRRAFRIGAVRLVVDPHRKHQMRRLRGQALQTASHLGDDLDDLSDFLGPDDQQAVHEILTRLGEIGRLPESYADLVRVGREAIGLYSGLLDRIADREGFEEDADYTTSTR